MKALFFEAGKHQASVIETSGKLDELQKLVGGYIEAVRVGNSTIWVNEDGKMRGLPVNPLATAFTLRHNDDFDDILVGNAVVLGTAVSGESTAAPEWAFESVRAVGFLDDAEGQS